MRTKKIYICSHVLYSMKKRTFVYLNSGLVERARRENINISGLTEEALRQSLEIEKPRTALEHLRELLADVGNETSMYGDVYFTPFQIQSLTLTKVGPFDNFQADFCRNSINLIYGPCGSGKSTMIRSILLVFGIRHRYFTNRVFADGKIKLRLFPNQDSININSIETHANATRGYQCLIADDALERLPKNVIAPLFTEVKRLRVQIIMTASPLIDKSAIPKGVHIISL